MTVVFFAWLRRFEQHAKLKFERADVGIGPYNVTNRVLPPQRRAERNRRKAAALSAELALCCNEYCRPEIPHCRRALPAKLKFE